MKPSRQFRPLAQDALEDRIAPSQIAGGVNHAGGANPHPPAQVRAGAPSAKGAAKANAHPVFAMNIADTIAAGTPVEEQRTTRYGGASTQTETRLIEPNTINSSTLTTAIISLRNNGGTERVTDFSYTSLTNSTVHVITTTLPDGSVQTENRTLQVDGDTTTIKGAVKLPNDGGVRAITGTAVDRGPVTTTDLTVTEPDGTVHHDHSVLVHRGESRETETVTVTNADGSHQVTRSTTTIVRLQPPTTSSVGTAAPAGPLTPPKVV